MEKVFFRNVVLFLLLSFVCSSVHAQPKIDSLLKLMRSGEADKLTDDARMKNYLTLASNYNHSKPDTSIVFAEKALDLAKKIPNRRGEGMALNMIAISMNNLSRTDSAKKYYEQALHIFETTHDTMGMMHLYNNLGNLTSNTGDYSTSIHYYLKVLNLAESSQKKELIALASNNLAIIYFDWSKYDLALDFYKKSLGILGQLNDTMKMAALFNNIGELYRETNQHDSALSNYQKALGLAFRSRNQKSMMNAYLNLGDAMKLRNMDQEAFAYYRLASEQAREIKSDYGIAYANIQQAELYLAENNSAKGGQSAMEGLRLAQKLKHVKLEKEAHFQLFRYYETTGNYQAALSHHLEFTNLKDTLFNQSSRKEIIRLQTEFETEKKEREIAQLNAEKATQELEIDRQKSLRIITTLIALTLLSGAAFFHSRSRVKQLAEKNKLEKQKYEVEQKLLRVQINPHFIFNSLNSIQGFMLGNNIGAAQSFLGKFAQLIRLILENSRKSLVSVEDEINTLQLNLELEQMRFANKFTFGFEIDENIDMANTYIPPMLIQPFVENALIHGIQPKKEEGQIQIRMVRSANAITAYVRDNGIGRDASSAIKSKQIKTHKSLGQQLTKERLELLGSKNGQTFYFEVSDLKDENGQATGTEVKIVMPWEED